MFLYKTEKSLEQWSKIAADKENPIFIVGDEISELCKIKTEMQSSNWDMNDERDKALVGMMSTWIDFYCYVEDIKMKMQPERFFSKMQIISLLGMAGIGKTTFARKNFKDMSIMCHFDHHVWITLGPKYEAGDILAKIYPNIGKLQMKEDEKVARDLFVPLSWKRCLIVMDDLCSEEPLHYLKVLFPDIKGKVLVTTRLAKLAEFRGDDVNYRMRFLNKDESWCLLCQKVFGEGLCPPALKKAGRKIAENCEGLPLLILKVADQLLNVEMSEECWNNVASGKQKSIFLNAHDQISKALLPSYESLPQHLKACFLYLGLFRNDYEIPAYRLTNLWTADGFLEPNSSQTIEDFVTECLCDLAYRSLVMVQRKVSDLQIKTCRLHSVFWHLSNSVAVRNRFFHALNSYGDCSVESMNSQRRLCIRNSILLGIKDVDAAMEESSKSRALLYTGPPHQYPVPLYFGSKLLRVLDALAICFYEFPVEVTELIHLTYLGLTCNGKLPTSISKLWKLQFLIVSPHINTRSSENSLLLPVEIWDMKELKHLQIMGGQLPNPKRGNVGLPKLSTLLDVSARSCAKKVLKRVPNLKKLGIRIELAPDDGGRHPFRCLNRISRLRRLESLKCVVVNPDTGVEAVAPPAPVSMFPSSLKKLSLSGFGYPWKYMIIIGKLQNLEVLKLKCYAFRGSKWENLDYTTTFSKLKFLLVEDTDLVHWEVKSCISMQLERLSIKHCYELEELPTYLPSRLEKIEVVDCNPLTVNWAEKMKETVTACKVVVLLSWIDSKLDP
ncbi:hypothetical protein C2S51_010423 [Perilla frutescens var. frutescens]|nr:hypothetical protein C2S51_010423 [Perilla frutescens var. frutescens]